MRELLEYIARGLVEHPDAVSVEIEEEDDDEIVRVLRDPAGNPFCLFVKR